MKIMTVKIRVEGKDDHDIEVGLGEAIRKINDLNTSGHDSTDTGAYSFEVKEFDGRAILA